MEYKAEITIHDTKNPGVYEKDFIQTLWEMGAKIKVYNFKTDEILHSDNRGALERFCEWE